MFRRALAERSAPFWLQGTSIMPVGQVLLLVPSECRARVPDGRLDEQDDSRRFGTLHSLNEENYCLDLFPEHLSRLRYWPGESACLAALHHSARRPELACVSGRCAVRHRREQAGPQRRLVIAFARSLARFRAMSGSDMSSAIDRRSGSNATASPMRPRACSCASVARAAGVSRG